MKSLHKLLLSTLVLGFVVACTPSADQTDASLATADSLAATDTLAAPVIIDGWESYGEVISANEAIAVNGVTDSFTAVPTELKITGTLLEVCQEKGCWTTIATDDGRNVHMTFKDYGFFLPKDAAGRTFVAEGIAFVKETSVEDQKRKLEESGATAEAIATITAPKVELAFEAKGVLLNAATTSTDVPQVVGAE
ncbi:MAG TPA: hypothetical protein DCE78_01720 [Bacteroidetes bacterium]|nr:hypothetical protein [Bacteroidota bacterium]